MAIFIGTAGFDTLTGSELADLIIGLAGDDILSGLGGNDLILGGEGDDILDGGNRNDLVFGASGNDSLLGGNGKDILGGGAGSDSMGGGAGDDIMSGGDGDDQLAGDDFLSSSGSTGAAGNDILNGGAGSDDLAGELGADTLTGGGDPLEADVFFYFSPAEGGDTITDFGVNIDKILVIGPSFGGQLVAGQLPDAQFNYGIMATEADDRFIYDNVVGSSMGTLFYDIDGMGGTEQVAIASLLGVPPLTANDILVFG